MARNRVIGAAKGLPWHIPAEYAQFLETVAGNTVLMGRRSFEIFGADLCATQNIVVSRANISFENAVVCASLEDAIPLAQSFGTEVFNAGGASLYRQLMPQCTRMILSIVKGEYDGDTYFPDINLNQWAVVETLSYEAYERISYERIPTQ